MSNVDPMTTTPETAKSASAAATLAPGLGSLAKGVATRGAIGAGGGAALGAGAGYMAAPEGQGLEGALRGGAAGAAVGGTLGAGSAALRSAPAVFGHVQPGMQEAAAHSLEAMAQGGATAPQLRRAMQSAHQGMDDLRGMARRAYGAGNAMATPVGVGATGLAAAGAGALGGMTTPTEPKTAGVGSAIKDVGLETLHGASRGALPGALAGLIASGEGNRVEGASRGAAMGALLGGAVHGGHSIVRSARGLTPEALEALRATTYNHPGSTYDASPEAIENLRALSATLYEREAAAQRLSNIAGDAALGLPVAGGAVGGFTTPATSPKEASVKTALSGLESALLHTGQGAVGGALAGGLAAGEGHRMEGAGRGAVAGAALGGGLHALNAGLLRARGLTPRAIDAAAVHASEQEAARVAEELQRLRNKPTNEFSFNDFVAADGKGVIAENNAQINRLEEAVKLWNAALNAGDVGLKLRQELNAKNQMQNIVHRVGHGTLPLAAGVAAGYTTPTEPKLGTAGLGAMVAPGGAEKQANAATSATGVPAEGLRELLRRAGVRAGSGMAFGGTLGGIGGALGAEDGQRHDAIRRGITRGASIGSALGVGSAGAEYLASKLSPELAQQILHNRGTDNLLLDRNYLPVHLGGSAAAFGTGLLAGGTPPTEPKQASFGQAFARVTEPPIMNYARGAGAIAGGAVNNSVKPIKSVMNMGRTTLASWQSSLADVGGHALGGAAIGGVTGAMTGGEGHRLEGAGRGALTGAALGTLVGAGHEGLKHYRGLTDDALHAAQGADNALISAHYQSNLDRGLAGQVAQDFDRSVLRLPNLTDSRLRQEVGALGATGIGAATGGGIAGYTTPTQPKQASSQVGSQAPTLWNQVGNDVGVRINTALQPVNSLVNHMRPNAPKTASHAYRYGAHAAAGRLGMHKHAVSAEWITSMISNSPRVRPTVGAGRSMLLSAEELAGRARQAEGYANALGQYRRQAMEAGHKAGFPARELDEALAPLRRQHMNRLSQVDALAGGAEARRIDEARQEALRKLPGFAEQVMSGKPQFNPRQLR